MVKNPKESTLCKAFILSVKRLRMYNYYKTDFEIIHIANEIVRCGNPIKDRNYLIHQMNMGMFAGCADYLMLYEGGKIAALEFKRDKSSKLTKNQKHFQSRCLALDIPYVCTYDIDEALYFVKSVLDTKGD